jgi:hypothetical protein
MAKREAPVADGIPEAAEIGSRIIRQTPRGLRIIR